MKIVGKWVLIVVGAFFLIGTLLPFIRTDEWWIRVFEFPRLQIAVCLAVVITLLLIFYRGRGTLLFAGALLLCGLYQTYEIFPYTPVAPEQTIESPAPDSTRSVSFMIANVLMDNRDTERFLATVDSADPDVLLVLEPNRWWTERIARLASRYPYRLEYPLENTYGMNLYSRLRLVDPTVRFIIEDTIPSIVASVALPSGDSFRLYCLHPRPPVPESNSDQRDAELVVVGKEVRFRKEPAIVIGDLNDVAWSWTTELFQEVSGLLDPRKGRGMYSTYNANIPLLRYPLDHLFHSEQFTLDSLATLPDIDSDHFPIFVKLTYRPEAAQHQDGQEVEGDDIEEGNELIEEAKEK